MSNVLLHTQAEVEDSLRSLGLKVGEGVKVSAGQIVDFEKGWALHWLQRKAHYLFKKPLVVIGLPSSGQFYFKSLCGSTFNDGIVFGAGSFEKCMHCKRMAKRLGKS